MLYMTLFLLSIEMREEVEIKSMKTSGNCPHPESDVKTTPTEEVVAGEELFKKWGEFLEELKKSKDLPIVALVKALKFYRDNIDVDVFIDFAPLDRRIFAYKIISNDLIKEIVFYTIDGIEFWFSQRAYYVSDKKHYGRLSFGIDHLARTEVIE